jgi:hypothetical protein
VEHAKLILKFTGKYKGPNTSKILFRKKINGRGFRFSENKSYYEAIVVKVDNGPGLTYCPWECNRELRKKKHTFMDY